MNNFYSEKTFKSSIPKKYRDLSGDSPHYLFDEVIEEYNVKIPDYIEEMHREGNISKEKYEQIKMNTVIHFIDELKKQEKEEWDKEHEFSFKNFTKKFKKDETAHQTTLLHAYESEQSGDITKEELDFILSSLK